MFYYIQRAKKVIDDQKKVIYYLEHDQAIPPFYAEELREQLGEIQKQSREAEGRFKELEQMYQKRERELKEKLYKQANHDIELNSHSAASTVLKKQSDLMTRRFQEKEAEVLILSKENKELKEEIKKLREINKEICAKLEIEERLTNRHALENALLKNYNPDEYSQNQHTALSLVHLNTGPVYINKFEDHKNVTRETERIVFNNFINMNIIEKITTIIKFPYYFSFSFSKKSSKFNTGQNCQNELFVFNSLAAKTYGKIVKAISIQAANWVNITSEAFQSIQKILTQCEVIKVLELNLENWETNSEETKNKGYPSIFQSISYCSHILVLHLNLSGQGNFSQDIWNSLLESFSSLKRLGELSLELSTRGSSDSGINPSQFDQLCTSISMLFNLENLALNFSEQIYSRIIKYNKIIF